MKVIFLLKTAKLLLTYPHESFHKMDWLPFGLQFVYYSMEWNPGRCDVTTSRHRLRHQRLPDSRQPQNKEISCPKLFLSTVTFVCDWTRAIVSTPVDGPWVAGWKSHCDSGLDIFEEKIFPRFFCPEDLVPLRGAVGTVKSRGGGCAAAFGNWVKFQSKNWNWLWSISRIPCKLSHTSSVS